MPKPSPKLDWCVVRLGDDLNWWVQEISDPVHWDVDSLSIIDPRQVAHILDLLDPLRDYGFQADIFEAAFFTFTIKESLPDNRVRLQRVFEQLLDSDDKLFALPDQVDEEKGPYADFLDHITKLRVKFLNDVFTFEQRLTVDDLEEQIREDHHNAFMEGRAIHAFKEIIEILEFVPEGYELDEEAVEEAVEKDEHEKIAGELPEVEEENIVEDETMKWDEEEAQPAAAAEEQTEDLDALEDDDEEEEEGDDDLGYPVDEDKESNTRDDDDDEEDGTRAKSKSGSKPAPSSSKSAPSKPGAKPASKPASKTSKPAAKKDGKKK